MVASLLLTYLGKMKKNESLPFIHPKLNFSLFSRVSHAILTSLHSYFHTLIHLFKFCAMCPGYVRGLQIDCPRMSGVEWQEKRRWQASSFVGMWRTVESILQVSENHWRVWACLCHVSIHEHWRWERDLESRQCRESNPSFTTDQLCGSGQSTRLLWAYVI